jgi:hypothetical protein
MKINQRNRCEKVVNGTLLKKYCGERRKAFAQREKIANNKSAEQCVMCTSFMHAVESKESRELNIIDCGIIG